MSYYIYVLQSKKDKKNYIGQTKDIQKRLNEHNTGKVKSTKSRRPFRLIYSERFDSRDEAVKREKELKSGQWRELLKRYLV